MTMNPLPPQAYTKDTLTKAYLWLLHQNDSIKELATTPDILVTLFLKAQRNGDESLDTPSIQNFKNELKSLAGMMGELEGAPSANNSNFRSGNAMPTPSSATPPPAAPKAPSATVSPQSQHQAPPIQNRAEHPRTETFMTRPSAPNAHTAPSGAYAGAHSAGFSQPAAGLETYQPSAQGFAHAGPAPTASAHAASNHANVTNSESIAQLDIRSRAMIAEVREQLNLGSDVEVLRLLISLGYKKARNLYS